MKFLHDEVTMAAQAYGSKIAFRSANEALTFVEFRDRVVGFAGALQQLGVGKGDRVSILADNSIDYLAYHYAATMAGAFLHVINVRLVLPEIVWSIDDAESRVLIVDEHYADSIASLREACAADTLTVVGIGDIDGVDFSSSELQSMRVTPREVAQDPSDPVVLIYTSGTTGRPKGALQTHIGSLHADRCTMDAVGFTESDRFLAVMPFFHQAGLIRPRANLTAGGENVVLGRMSPDEVCDAVRKYNISVTMVASVPQITAMTQAAMEAPGDFEDLRLLISGGGMGSARMQKMQMACQVLGCDYMGVYGQTEATGPVTVSRGPDCFERPDSCGTALPGFDLEIWGEDQTALAPGKRGEVMIRSVATATYWRNDEANDSLYSGQWLHTGDLGYLDEDGFLFLAGRSKELIKTGAENVYPKEVEDILATHPSIQDVVVFGMPDEKWGEAVVAAVILADDASLTIEQLKEFCQGKIGGYKIPKRLYPVDEIPHNETGKPLKHVLRKRLEDSNRFSENE